MLKQCPCGKTPESLSIVDNGQGSKWASIYPSCCGEWSIEFRTNYELLHSKDCMDLAVNAWNEAPRAFNNEVRDEMAAD